MLSLLCSYSTAFWLLVGVAIVYPHSNSQFAITTGYCIIRNVCNQSEESGCYTLNKKPELRDRIQWKGGLKFMYEESRFCNVKETYQSDVKSHTSIGKMH